MTPYSPAPSDSLRPVARPAEASADSLAHGGASVLIPVLNEEAHIRETVAAMQRQRFDGHLEFLVIDGGSTDRTREIIEELRREDPRVRILDNPARHTAAALNVGLRAARGEFVARMDAHALYPADYVRRGVERLRAGDVAWVSGPAIPDGTGRWSRRVALALRSGLGTGTSKKQWVDAVRSDGDEVELDTGVFAGVWKRADVAAHGGWDEGWPINQDSELAARFLAAGQRIVSMPPLAARYVPRNSLRGLARQYFRYGMYRAKTARRHPTSLRRAHLLPPGLALGLATAVLAPSPVRRAGRLAVGAYALAMTGATARAVVAGHGRDGSALAAVLATMHLSWGSGFLAGCARYGLPLGALARVALPTRFPRRGNR